jgi:hypothetical protein
LLSLTKLAHIGFRADRSDCRRPDACSSPAAQEPVFADALRDELDPKLRNR